MGTLRRRYRALLAIPVLLIGFILASELAGWPFLRGALEHALQRRLERAVKLAAPFELHLLGGVDVRAARLWIAAPEGFDVPHLVDARDLSLALRWRDLLALRDGAPLRVEALDVGRIDARLVRHADGRATWPPGKPDDGGPRAGKPRALPQVGYLSIRDGEVRIDDRIAKADIKAQFSTEEGSGDQLPSSRAEFSGRLHGRPLAGKLVTAGFMRLTEREEAAQPVPTTARIDYGGVHVEFDGTLSRLSLTHGLEGEALVRGPSLSLLGELFGLVLPTTAEFSLRGALARDGEVWRVDLASATVGRSRLGGRFTFDPRAQPPELKGTLQGERFVLADLAPALGTRNPDGSAAPPPAGQVLPHRELALDALKGMTAHLAVDLAHVELGAIFAQPIAPLRAKLDLADGRLALTGIDARTAKGRLHGEIAVDASSRVALWRAGLGWSEIRLGEWFAAPGNAGGTARDTADAGIEEPYVSGTLHGRSKLTGHGNAMDEVLGSLDGELTLFVRNGSLSHLVVELIGLDVAQSLGVLVRGDERLPARCAVAQLAARNGRLTPQVALIDTPASLVLVDGGLDLGGERLDLRLVAKPKNVSPFTLRSPIHVRGSFADPRVAPEAKPLAVKVLAGIALGLINPLAAVIPFIDPGEAVGTPCRDALAALED